MVCQFDCIKFESLLRFCASKQKTHTHVHILLLCLQDVGLHDLSAMNTFVNIHSEFAIEKMCQTKYPMQEMQCLL